MLHTFFSLSPTINAIISAPRPENIPFMVTICCGSFDDSTLVQLFSIPQDMQASKMNKEPYETPKDSEPSKESNVQESITNAIPSQSLVLIFSLNTAKAITDVATISKLLSKDALAALVIESPSNKNIGATISSTTIAITYGNSFFVIFSSIFGYLLLFLIININPIPIPAPIYKNPAIKVDVI